MRWRGHAASSAGVGGEVVGKGMGSPRARERRKVRPKQLTKLSLQSKKMLLSLSRDRSGVGFVRSGLLGMQPVEPACSRAGERRGKGVERRVRKARPGGNRSSQRQAPRAWPAGRAGAGGAGHSLCGQRAVGMRRRQERRQAADDTEAVDVPEGQWWFDWASRLACLRVRPLGNSWHDCQGVVAVGTRGHKRPVAGAGQFSCEWAVPGTGTAAGCCLIAAIALEFWDL